MNKSIKLSRLKAKAKKHYLAYMGGGSGLDCGHALADYIRPHKAIHATKFNEDMEQIEKLVPDECPKWDRL